MFSFCAYCLAKDSPRAFSAASWLLALLSKDCLSARSDKNSCSRCLLILPSEIRSCLTCSRILSKASVFACALSAVPAETDSTAATAKPLNSFFIIDYSAPKIGSLTSSSVACLRAMRITSLTGFRYSSPNSFHCLVLLSHTQACFKSKD